jgi:putative (di)nucleoside polyphosphate hydrolase
MAEFQCDRYRRGVGIVLLNEQGQIFVARRRGIKDAWQMPQGGINDGEHPEEAARRELREEIGTNCVDLIADSDRWFRYEVPPELIPKSWNDRWRGQIQKWMVMMFRGADSDIDLATEQPEFDAWQWVDPAQLPAIAVGFKRQLYADVIGEFANVFRD